MQLIRRMGRILVVGQGHGASRLGGSCGVALGLCLITLAGCSREYYRQQADEEAYALVREKSSDPRWDVPGFSIELDPRSRYYDSNDPDYPPMPPDDPVSHEFMHCVDCKNGWHWHDTYGSVSELDTAPWRERLGEYMELTEDGRVKLGLGDTVRLAMMHSPGWQQQLETLYLSALTVSTERFRFDVQFFGGNDTTFNHRGAERGFGGSSNTLTTASDFEIRRRFATAGQLLVGFANTFVWEFAGPNANTMANSLINFSLVQPLLRRAGQDVELELLTRAERGLLANLRAYERYRKGFFTGIAVGSAGAGTGGTQRTGGFQGGTGITGFTGQGGAGLGQVGGGFGRGAFFGGGGGVGGGGAAGAAGVAGGGAGAVGGFIGLLQQLQNLRNQRDSLDAQLRAQGLLEAQLEAGQIDIIQVDRLRQAILTAQANMLATQNGFDNAVQAFIMSTFALPPDLPVELDDSIIRPFQFIDRRVTEVQNDMTAFIDRFGELPQEPAVEALQRALDEMASLRARAATLFDLVRSDLEHLEAQAPIREQYTDEQQRKEFLAIRAALPESLSELDQRFEATGRRLEELRAGLTPAARVQTANGIVEVQTELSAIVQEASLVQARARVESVVLEPFRMSVEDAVEIARANRLDWMNARAGLVDAWRLIQFNADALQSDLSIVASGDIGTLDRNVVKFRGENGSLRLGVQFDAPLTRITERNNFRAQLIEYQQDRRQLIQFEDQVWQSMDQVLRQLEQLELNQEIQRQAVITSIRRVDQVLESLREPPAPALPGQPAQGLGETIAENLLSALEDLGGAQSNFMSVWIAHYGARMGLMRDLGLMRLDENNLWVDEPLEDALRAAEENQPYPMPPEVPEGWILELEGDPHASDRVVDATVPDRSSEPRGPLTWLRGVRSRIAGALHGTDRSRDGLDEVAPSGAAGANQPMVIGPQREATPLDRAPSPPRAIVPAHFDASPARRPLSRADGAAGRDRSTSMDRPLVPAHGQSARATLTARADAPPAVATSGADADFQRWLESRKPTIEGPPSSPR